MNLIIKNGRVLDPAANKDEMADIYVKNGRIANSSEMKESEADRIIDASGCFVMPGLIDLHVHLREPGGEHKETIETGTKAAAKGGFTTVCPMPNTAPAVDSPEMIEKILSIAAETSPIHVVPVGAVTIGQQGKVLTDMAAMAKAGAKAVSEDGKSVMNTGLYRKAMLSAKQNNMLVMAHCEDKELVGKGVLNAGKKADELKMEGISNAVEDVIAARDIILAKETGVRLHLCHCSTRDSVKMIAEAKKQGLLVSGEVCPHHFTLTEDDINGDDANYKMNPPLRSKEDVEALKEGLKAGIMDVISTDHAPHHEEEKKKSIQEAPFGIVGSETAVCLTITELVKQGYLTPLGMAEKMSTNPARILGIDRGSLQQGKAADITIINPDEEYRIDVNAFISKGKNSPFHGRRVQGKVKFTIVDGIVVYEDVAVQK